MISEPRCYKRKCKHFIGVLQPDGTELSEVVVCKAFPVQIPNEIAYGDNLHLDIEEGQENNIVYEKE